MFVDGKLYTVGFMASDVTANTTIKLSMSVARDPVHLKLSYISS